jgi:hypothetical protein
MLDTVRTATVLRTISSRSLLKRAADIYDAPDSPLAKAAAHGASRGFQSGAEWMKLAMETIRGRALEPVERMPNFHFLGIAKYTAASVVAAIGVFVADWFAIPVLVVLAIPLFYAVEAQGVFLFPVALDGYAKPIRTARQWTVHAGGTLRVMLIVMPIAVVMLGGGFLGRGFLRSWCLGCLAVCLWYEQIRAADPLAV